MLFKLDIKISFWQWIQRPYSVSAGASCLAIFPASLKTVVLLFKYLVHTETTVTLQNWFPLNGVAGEQVGFSSRNGLAEEMKLGCCSWKRAGVKRCTWLLWDEKMGFARNLYFAADLMTFTSLFMSNNQNCTNQSQFPKLDTIFCYFAVHHLSNKLFMCHFYKLSFLGSTLVSWCFFQSMFYT